MKRLMAALVAACGVASCAGTPSNASTAPTSVAPATTIAPPPTIAPTAGPSPAAPAPAATAPTAAPSSTPDPPIATKAAARTYVVQKEGSKLRLVVNETLARIKLPSDAVLETNDLAGQIVLDGDGNVGAASRFTVDFRTLKSDDEDRDVDVQENILETARFPQGVFVPKELRGLPKPLPASGPIKGQLAGELTVHGVTRPAVFDVVGTLQGDTFTGRGVTDVLLTDFGMKIPTLAILLRVDNRVHAEITLNAKAE